MRTSYACSRTSSVRENRRPRTVNRVSQPMDARFLEWGLLAKPTMLVPLGRLLAHNENYWRLGQSQLGIYFADFIT